jgi:hypothetical protein
MYLFLEFQLTLESECKLTSHIVYNTAYAAHLQVSQKYSGRAYIILSNYICIVQDTLGIHGVWF